MEVYILSKEDLSILSVTKLSDYQINLDEETNAKSTFTLITTYGLQKDNFLVINGLYRQFLFIIDEVQSEKDSIVSTVTCLDISNIFDRKVIEENTDEMTTDSIELFLAHTIANNFVNSDDQYLNIGYIDIYVHSTTQGIVSTNAENGLYNFHTFMINCRQNKNVYTDFKFENGKLRIDISYKSETTQMIDTTLPEVINYNKIKEEDITAKVTVLIREDNSIYNLYLKTDRTTTTDKDDPDRASGKIEVISVDTADKAPEEALNVIKGNRYKHLVEFQIAKTSKLMDITQLTIGRPILIKTNDDVYESYISAITLTDENFVYFKSGSLRDTFIEKLKSTQNDYGNKIDVTSVVDNLNSVNPYAPLSANQGKILDIKLTGDVLYNNSSGANNNIPLSESVSNYVRIKIFYKVVMTNYTAHYSREFAVNVGDVIALNSPRLNSDSLWINDVANYILNTSSLTKLYEDDVRIGAGGGVAFNQNTSRTLITKIVGYKY